MFFRLLLESFVRQRRRKLLAGIAILLGTTAVTAMLALATTIGDRIHKELAVYGANIVIYPKAEQLAVKVGGVDIKPATGNAYLHESDLPKLKSIFWANNITGVSPELSFNMQVGRDSIKQPISTHMVGYWFDHDFANLKTGAPALHPWWRLQGTWPTAMNPTANNDVSDTAVGAHLAQQLGLKIGDTLYFSPLVDRFLHAERPGWGSMPRLKITGIVTTGDDADNQVFLPLSDAQFIVSGVSLGRRPDPISRVEVSARTKPEDAFARVDPETLSPAQREIWYCRPYANSIAYQIRETIPAAAAEQIRKVEQTEGTVLSRISGLMWLISAAALLAAGFAVSAAMATAILERRGEIGLMRSLGASKASIALLFYAETGLLAILAGTLGYLLGSGLAAWLGARIFAGSGLPNTTASSLATASIFIPVLLPVVVATALIVAIAGSTPSIRTALKMDPSVVLRADA
jgi:putative ABC transport system permease protein